MSDETMGIRAPVTFLEMRERPVMIPTHNSLTTNGLLPDTACHLGQVEHRTSCTGYRHDHRAVSKAKVPPGNLTRLVTGFSQYLHDLHLESLFNSSPGHGFKLPVFVYLDPSRNI
jgi:hypothetical protein